MVRHQRSDSQLHLPFMKLSSLKSQERGGQDRNRRGYVERKEARKKERWGEEAVDGEDCGDNIEPIVCLRYIVKNQISDTYLFAYALFQKNKTQSYFEKMPPKDQSDGKSSFKHQAVRAFEALLTATKIYRKEYYDWGRIFRGHSPRGRAVHAAAELPQERRAGPGAGAAGGPTA